MSRKSIRGYLGSVKYVSAEEVRAILKSEYYNPDGNCKTSELTEMINNNFRAKSNKVNIRIIGRVISHLKHSKLTLDDFMD